MLSRINFIRISDPETGEDEIIFKHNWDDEIELRLELISAVSELTEMSPQRIGTELRRSADLDALDRIFESQAEGVLREGGMLLLLVASCEVSIQCNGWVEVTRVAG